MSVSAAIIGVGVALGVGCLLGAVAYWWQGVKARYDPVFIGRVLEVKDGDSGLEAELEFNEKALRRMMKETSKEMDWTKVRWQ